MDRNAGNPLWNGYNPVQGTNSYQLDPVVPSYAPNSSLLDPKFTAYSASRSFVDTESHRSTDGIGKSPVGRQHGSRHNAKRWGYSLRNWSWELATWFLGTVAFVVIVVLLITFSDKRFDSWHSDIQITTIIAALSQLAQSALLVSLAACLGQLKWTWLRDERSAQDLQLFDEASRGPYGSLRLLGLGLLPSGATRRRSFGFPKLAVLGALAVILMLAFSTFAQQAVAIVLRPYVVDGANPGLNRTTRYEQLEGTTLLGQGASANADPMMNDAINSGMLSRVISLSDISGECASERCDWSPYWTLAICPTVEDVTSRITSVSPGTVEGVKTFTSALSNASYISLSIASDPTYLTIVNRTRPVPTLEHGGIVSDSLLFWYDNDPCSPSWTLENQNQVHWKAYHATFNLCLQRLNSSFHNSSMHTQILESKLDIGWRAEGNGSGSYDICGDSPDGAHCVDENYIESWAFALNQTFNGTAMTPRGGDNYYRPPEVRRFVTDILSLDPTKCGVDRSQAYQAFEKRVQNVASAMSNNMRLAPNASTIFGTAIASAQFIDVNPQWLAYPAALWVMSTIFLLGTISHSRSSGAPLWKSSSLALLTSRDPNNDLRSEYEVTRAFKHTGMQLRDNGYGWQLVQNEAAPVR